MRKRLSDIYKILLAGIYIFCFTSLSPIFSQKNISGVINQYREVVSIGSDFVTLSDVSPFSSADTVMIMQMSGVVVQETGEPGQLQTWVGNPGAYEYLIVSSVNAGTKTVYFTRSIKNNYDTRGLVQLITVPSYTSAVVNAPLTCMPWDSSTVTGGVLTFFVRQKLVLNDSVYATGKGFKGGAVSNGSGECVSTGPSHDLYFYNVSSDYSGYKGEGVGNRVNNQSTLIFPGYGKGKAPSYTGGGGGNGYSSGGGGGSGYGAGSTGDNESAVCSTGPGLGIGGIGGKAIAGYDLDGFVFMGGGGGASTYPYTPNVSTGGNGGGIILIFADTIVGNGMKISSGGVNAPGNTVEGAGAGGGGGGGSVIISSRYFSSNPIISVKGGHGGNTVNTSTGGCAGGGGGGGLVWTRLPFTGSCLVNGGTGGYKSSTPSNKDGSAGKIMSGILLPLNGFLFNAVYSSKTLSETDSICEGMTPPVISGTQPDGGTPPYSYLWEKSYDNSTWISTTGSGLNFESTDAETQTVWFRRRVTDNDGIPDYSQPVKIIVHKKINDNVFNADTTICYNQDPLPLIASKLPSGGTGVYNYSWQQSTNNVDWNATDGYTSSYDPGTIGITTFYRRTINSGACINISSSVKITVLPAINKNNITDNQTICEGSSFVNLSGSLPAGGDGAYSYKWIASDNQTDWSLAPGTGSEANYDPQNDQPGRYYFKRVVISGLHDCCADTSASIALVSNPVIKNNIISSSQTICEGSLINDLSGTTPGGGAGDGTYTYQWQESVDGANWSDISKSTLQNFAGVKIYAQTYFRRIVNSSVCTDAGNNVLISVIPAIKNYGIALDAMSHDTIASGMKPGKISGNTLSGGTNTYDYSWSYSENSSDYSSLNSSGPDYQPGNLEKTTWFKRTVTSGLCTESAFQRITALSPISGNIISGDQHICNVDIPAEIAGQIPSGGDGHFRYLWEKSDEGSDAWSAVTGTDDGQNYGPSFLNNNTLFRRIALSGENNCCADTSDVVVVKVDKMPENITAGNDSVLVPFQFAYTLKGHFDGAGVCKWTVVSSNGAPAFDNDSDPGTIVRKLGFGDNTLKFQVTNDACKAEEVDVTLNIPKITVPEGFSPNGDGINDYFLIKGLEYTTNELVIINTGGAVVYKKTNYRSDNSDNAWDGLDNNGDKLPEGTYYYLLTINGLSDSNIPKYVAHISGFVIIRR